MEKIMNLQMPGSMSSGSGSRSVQRGDLGEGFLKMMQQKQETSGSDSKTEKAETPVKDAQSKPKEEPEEVPAEDQEPTDELDLLAQELAAQQVAVQQTVVTPDWQEQPVQTEPVVEAAALELTAELPAEEPKMPVAGDMDVQQMPEHADAKPAEDLTPQQAVPETKPEEEGREMSLSEQMAGVKTEEAAPKETIQKSVSEPVHEKVSGKQEDDPKEVYSQETHKQPVVERSSSVRTTEQTEGTNLKTTVEELPERLGKALASGQTAGSQTLTVELEPVSLGKLTVRVEYEEGRAAVSILSSNPKTLELLSQKASEIATILKEHTGEETVIYTQEAQQQQEQNVYDGHQGQSRGDQNGQKQQKEEERHETESFAQQLRLGLV